MSQDEKIFANGFSFKRRDNAPEFVVGRLSLKVDDAMAFVKEHMKNGWINLNVNQARSGNYYVELDTYEAKSEETPQKKEAKEEGLPF
ncbi:MAG: hypothetical protein GY845_28935 [Planctomycetes bacterium]|nr:hypothetical protein [Planctomycetota bacterium]